MTQEALAQSSGTSRAHLIEIEAGTQNTTLDRAEKLALAVGRSLIQLLGTTPEEGNLSIELPSARAFDVARVAARELGTAIPLIDPITRQVAAVVPKPSG